MNADAKTTVDYDPVIEFYKKDVDRTLLRENLKLTVQQRFEKFERVFEYAQELRAAGTEREANNEFRTKLSRNSTAAQ